MYKLIQGDCLDVLKTLPDNFVQCVVTSPPYWGLRDYGTSKWEGGNVGCDHKVGRFTRPVSEKQHSNNGSGDIQARNVCPKCGAVRVDLQLGLESTPEAYVANMVVVFREVHRVLCEDGTLWLNLGDCYNGSTPNKTGQNGYNDGRKNRDKRYSNGGCSGLKPKDLIGIPWRVAFALQADGWWLRQDIIWAKPNPMPESVKDRCTKSHEYVFLLAKNARYYFDSETLKEPSTTCGRGGISNKSHSKRCGMGLESSKDYMPSGTRNKRDVWTVNTQSYSGAHYAVMPEKLVEPCILAGSRPGDTILDPFSGAGTVGLVAVRLNRAYIGIELNPIYLEMSRDRIREATDDL